MAYVGIKTTFGGSYRAKCINFCISIAGASELETPLSQEELEGKPLKINPQSTFCLLYALHSFCSNAIGKLFLECVKWCYRSLS